jgi:hypothetical protein
MKKPRAFKKRITTVNDYTSFIQEHAELIKKVCKEKFAGQPGWKGLLAALREVESMKGVVIELPEDAYQSDEFISTLQTL